MKKYVFFFFLVAAGLADRVMAQDTVLPVLYKGKLDSIPSGILKQKRYIQVFIPQDYVAGSATKYDVLYVLDGGNWNAGLLARIEQFIEGEGQMPPTLIVSVMGIDRNVELTPTHLDSWKGSGGGDPFLGYITKELIPYIDKTYPSNGVNTLWGHSLSGMFAIYALFKAPGVFQSFIATDPSLWWDNGLVNKLAAAQLPSMTDLKATLFIGGRDSSAIHGMGIDGMELILKKSAPAGLKWKLVSYDDETHSSVRLKTIYDGLKFTYAGFVSELQFYPGNGIVLKDSSIHIWYFDDPRRTHYTLDGTVPTQSSPMVSSDILLKGAGKVSFKRLTNRPKNDLLVTGDFVAGEKWKPFPRPKKAVPGGFNYRYYEGNWDVWPDLSKLTPVKTGITDSTFDIDKLPRKKNYALVIDGFLEVKEDGYYLFLFDADSSSKMYLGDKLLMTWNGNYVRRSASYIVPLSKGSYPFRVEYLHKKQDFGLRVTYLPPPVLAKKGDPAPIPFSAQYGIR